MLLHILIPRVLEMREQLMKFHASQTSHGKQKLRMLLDLMVGKHHPILLEEKNRSIHQALAQRIMLRRREFHNFLIYRIIHDNVYYKTAMVFSKTENFPNTRNVRILSITSSGWILSMRD